MNFIILPSELSIMLFNRPDDNDKMVKLCQYWEKVIVNFYYTGYIKNIYDK